MVEYSQGDIIKIEGQKDAAFVVSKSFYNKSGQVLACPMVKDAKASPVTYEIDFEEKIYGVLTDQVKKFDLSVRGSKKIGHAGMPDIMQVSDILQALFEY